MKFPKTLLPIYVFFGCVAWTAGAIAADAPASAPASASTPVLPAAGFIDTHVHAMECAKDGLEPVDAWMKRMNVTHCIIHPLDHKGSRAVTPEERKVMLENYAKYKGRIHRFCVIYPADVKTVEDAVKILEQEKKDGAIGFGEHYGVNLVFDDPKNMLMYEACSHVGFPVMFHIDRNKNMDEPGFPHLENVLKTYPKCVLIAHAFWWRQVGSGACERLLQTYPNLYADLSPDAVRSLKSLPDGGRSFVIKNADKLIFGTDCGWWSFGKPDTQVEWTYFESLDLPLEVKNKIYRENATRVLKLDGK